MPVSCRHDMCSSVFVTCTLLTVRCVLSSSSRCVVTVMDIDVALPVLLLLKATFNCCEACQFTVLLVFLSENVNSN